MSDPPLVSVVTPVYNGQRYLEECIQSVMSQTYSNWEYLVCDNMSTDQTIATAERLAAQDPRIRVVRATEFLDIYGNHNRALTMIDPTSRYCKIVHADDWLFPECLERMVSVAEAHPSVGLVSAFRSVGRHVEHISPVPYPESCMSGREVIRREFVDKRLSDVMGSPTSTMLRADLVREREEFYDRSVWHADTDAAHRVLLTSDLGFVHQVLTHTRQHTEALTTFSFRVYSFITIDGRVLRRYGPHVFSEKEFRARWWQWLRRYGRWLLREQLTRPSRLWDKEFHDFHRGEIGYLIADSDGDRATQTVLAFYRRFLL